MDKTFTSPGDSNENGHSLEDISIFRLAGLLGPGERSDINGDTEFSEMYRSAVSVCEI